MSLVDSAVNCFEAFESFLKLVGQAVASLDPGQEKMLLPPTSDWSRLKKKVVLES